jgi:hypothetical protein
MNNDYRINWKKLAITQEGEGTIVHPLVALALTPIMGLAFLMFLPFVGFYLALSALFQKVGHLVTGLFETLVKPSPVTGTAHLTGQEGTTGSDDLKELDKEIQARRSK